MSTAIFFFSFFPRLLGARHFFFLLFFLLRLLSACLVYPLPVVVQGNKKRKFSNSRGMTLTSEWTRKCRTADGRMERKKKKKNRHLVRSIRPFLIHFLSLLQCILEARAGGFVKFGLLHFNLCIPEVRLSSFLVSKETAQILLEEPCMNQKRSEIRKNY